MREHQSDLEASYDRVAAKYADEFFSELERKPFDRELLENLRVGSPVSGRYAKLAVARVRFRVT